MDDAQLALKAITLLSEIMTPEQRHQACVGMRVWGGGAPQISEEDRGFMYQMSKAVATVYPPLDEEAVDREVAAWPSR